MELAPRKKKKQNKLRKKVIKYTLLTIYVAAGLLLLILLMGVCGDFWSKWTKASREYYDDWLAFQDCTDQSSLNYVSEEKRQNDLEFCKRKSEAKNTWPVTRAFDDLYDELRIWFGVFVFRGISNALYSWYSMFFVLVCVGLLLIFFKPNFFSQGQQNGYGGGGDRVILVQGPPMMNQFQDYGWQDSPQPLLQQGRRRRRQSSAFEDDV